MIDTHAHLDAEEAHAELERARAAGVSRVLAVGTTLEGSRKTLALADEHESVFAVLGLHPHEADVHPDVETATPGSTRSARTSRASAGDSWTVRPATCASPVSASSRIGGGAPSVTPVVRARRSPMAASTSP